MPDFVDSFAEPLGSALSAARGLPSEVSAVKGLDDESLLAAQSALAEIRQLVDACSSLVAGEIGHRSRRELGYGGLAQRQGFRTPQALVQHHTGSSAKEANALVTVGGMMHDALRHDAPETPREPWLAAVGRAVNGGSLPVESANAIRVGLGQPSTEPGTTVSEAALARAAEKLIVEASGLDADRLLRRAHELRDEIDEAGIADRERAFHEQRSIRRFRRSNGLSRYVIDADIESSALLDDIYDKLTAPRRGGARFVDEAGKAWAEGVLTDTRTTEQYVHDSIVELLRIAVQSETNESRRIVGSRMPSVRVLVTADALARETGHGHIEGTPIPVSIATVERTICGSGVVPIAFDENGQVINLGREQRLFSPAQRIALAARDGGCRVDGCDRPPGWTEAHHIDHWQRDHGRTDLADGILLCRYHHMLLHNNQWEIRRAHGHYWLIPPPDVDPARTPALMPSKSAALRDLERKSTAG